MKDVCKDWSVSIYTLTIIKTCQVSKDGGLLHQQRFKDVHEKLPFQVLSVSEMENV